MAKKDNSLTFAIIFAAVTISGSLIFFATQFAGGGMSDEELAKKISAGIEDYVENYENGGSASAGDVVDGDFADDQPFIGEEDAPVTLVEFSDYRCGYCQKFHDETYPQLKEKYIDTGKVKFVYRDYLLGYSGDYEAALVAECTRDQGGDEAFFQMHDYIFQTVSQGFDLDKYVTYAAEIDLDGEELRSCVEDEKFKEEIYGDIDAGKSAGVSGTPGFLLNNKFISGAQPYATFEQLIEAELAK